MHYLTADWALLEDGFAASVTLGIQDGLIASIEPGDTHTAAERVAGVMLPGLSNVHSHGFQRVFAGTTHWTGAGGDFWSWREAMYRAAAWLTPNHYAPVFAWLCKELLKGGFTALAEFHYLQHQPGSRRYVPETAMADALADAAWAAGMPLTLLVGIYETGGFDGEPLAGGQLRFANTADDALRMAASLQTRTHVDFRVGLAPHSLRAVPAASLAAIGSFTGGPIHIHVAEQTGEVEACLRTRGAAPVAWLLDNAPVDARWCLIHATHAKTQEIAAAAASGAVIGLCPSTEADLGDGVFDFPALQRAKGAFGIGTDSNTATSALGELRLLEYAQRLHTRRRNVAAQEHTPPAGRRAGLHGEVAEDDAVHTGTTLWQAAARGGAQACGRAAGCIAVGRRADLAVVTPTEETAHAPPAFVLDAAMFAATREPVRHVMTSGRWVVRDGVHVNEATIDRDYRRVLQSLADAS